MALSKAGVAALIDTIMIRCRRMISTPITSTRTLTHSDLGHNLVDASTGDIVINLPPADVSLGAVDTLFRRIDSSAYSVTIVCPGTDKIVLDNPAGVASVLLPGQGSVLEIRANTAGFWYSLAMSASQAVVNAGVDDTQAVTPKKLKFGFSSLFAANGYLVLPTWLGGFIFQWGKTAPGPIPTGGQSIQVPWPITFPNALYYAGGSCDATGSGTNTVFTSVFNLNLVNFGLTVGNYAAAVNTNGTFYFGIGR